jgi:hypothetical protein
LPAAGHRGDEAGGGAGAARPLPRSQAAAATAEPEGTQAARAARQEGSLALAAAGGEAAACHPGAQRPAGPARSAASRAHAWTEEGRRRCAVIFIPGVLILVSGAAGADKDGGQEAQEKDRYRPFSCL